MINIQASEFFKNIKLFHKDIDDNFEPPPSIIPTLRTYQRRAIKWMVDKEKNNHLVRSDGSTFNGGILADEMGLGKTVEMLCCIVENIAPPEFYLQKIILSEPKLQLKPVTIRPSTSKYISYSSNLDLDKKSRKSTRSMLNNWYQNVLNDMSTLPKKSNDVVEDDFIIECYCITTPPISTLVICSICGKGQHAECVHFVLKPLQEVPYLCANCWTLNNKLQCKATLIVVPQSILNQWIDEINKHIANPGLKVLIYNGVHCDGYIQPISFNEYDIVLTSYNNLLKDLNYVGNDLDDRNLSRLRYSKKYNYPQSPLPCIKWWRICLDEGQAIENTQCKVFEMTSCLESVNKWAMTGTPIQKSLNDLYGILKFFDVSPYCNRKQFVQLLNGDASFMYNWFSNIIWRNLISDVNSELNIPKITTVQHWLTFSEIEKHFYLSQHDDCANDFSNITTRLYPSLDISVKHIEKKKIYNIISPLYKLRQACVHPQAVNGQFVKIKGTLTMEKLMDVMIEKCRIECNDVLRSLVSEHNALAGLYLIRFKYTDAVQHYKTVLDLMEKYKDRKIQVDIYQKIHVMYNLSNVLDDYEFNGQSMSFYLKSSDLKNTMKQLEKEYLDASKQNIETTRQTVTLYSDKVANLIEDKSLSYSDWWSDMLDWIFSPKDFLTKVQAELEDYRVIGVPNIANKLKSVNDVYNILSTWLIDLDFARGDTISKLQHLEQTPMNDLVLSALSCHLRLKSKKNASKNKCLLCKAEIQLQAYESLLFSVSNKQKNTLVDTTIDEETIYECSSRGLWKMSQKEFLLMKLFQYGQAKIINTNCLKDAAEHMKILELVRKEFRYLRLLWTHLSDSLSAHDEIVMAKSRLRIENPVTLEPDENGPPKKKTKRQNENDVILEQYVDYNIISIKTQIPITKAMLEKKIGTLIFLENLKKEKENSTEIEPCPICCLINNSGWAVMQCGHSICSLCLAAMCNHSMDACEVVCPMCRNNTPIDSISYAKLNKEGEVPNIKGSFSTKIESITLKLMELIAEDPTVKVLVFSTWEKAINLLGEALEQNSVCYRILKTGNKYKKTLNDFKINTKINALLMKLSLGAKGLNLTEATRIFFMEPIINKADELQAIGRIHRIGQTKPTFVHHFIHRDSIEENITKIFSTNELDRWDDITLSQLIKVFERNESNEMIQPVNNI